MSSTPSRPIAKCKRHDNICFCLTDMFEKMMPATEMTSLGCLFNISYDVLCVHSRNRLNSATQGISGLRDSHSDRFLPVLFLYDLQNETNRLMRNTFRQSKSIKSMISAALNPVSLYHCSIKFSQY